MSFVVAVPDVLQSAASELTTLASTLGAANAAAASPTTAMLAAAQDEVSAAIAALFSAHGQAYQSLSAQAEAFQAQFVEALTAGAGSYASAEAASAAALSFPPNPFEIQQALVNLINTPFVTLTGRPLIATAPTAPRAPGKTAPPAAGWWATAGPGAPARPARRAVTAVRLGCWAPAAAVGRAEA